MRPRGCPYVDASASPTHLSLSLSLYSRFSRQQPGSGAENGAPDHLLAGSRRALGCGVDRSLVLAFSAKRVRTSPRPISPRSRAGRGEVPDPALLGCPPHNPGEAIKGAWALAPSRARFPGRRGSTDLGPRRPPIFKSSRAPRRSPSFISVQGGEGQAGQGRSERSVLRTRAIEDAEMRSSSPSWGGGS